MEVDNIVVTKTIMGRIWEWFCNRGVIIIRIEEIKIK